MNSQRRAHQHSPNVVPHSHSQRIPVHIQRRANPPAHSQSSLTSTLRLASRLGPLQDSLRFKTLFASRPASLQDPLRFKTRFASRPASLQDPLRFKRRYVRFKRLSVRFKTLDFFPGAPGGRMYLYIIRASGTAAASTALASGPGTGCPWRLPPSLLRESRWPPSNSPTHSTLSCMCKKARLTSDSW